MANYTKSFNFRNGVQVDNNHFIINANGLVGIGSTIPTQVLDVVGNINVSGFVTAPNLYTTLLSAPSASITTVTAGVVTAGYYYGDGSRLINLPTTQWISSGNNIYYTTGFIGIANANPGFTLQVGGNPNNSQSGVGISSAGNIFATGIVTATSFVGSGANITNITANNITAGILSNSYLPSNINVSGIITASGGFVGNITGNLTGNVVGIASTANSITTTANIIVNSINSGFSTTGISTIYTKLYVPGKIGVGTLTPSADINIRRSGISSIQLTSDGSYESTITFGRNVIFSANNAQIRFGNTNLAYTSSTEQSLDIINYDTGNINFYLNPGGSGTGSFNWFKPSLSRSMILTSSGNLGINSNSPTELLSVGGDVKISGIATIGSLNINNTLNVNQTLGVVGNTTINGNLGIATSSPAYTLQIGSNPLINSGVGISSSGNIIASGYLSVPNVSLSGIITASNGFTSGVGTAVKISTIGNQLIFTVPGVGSTSLTLF